METRLLTQQTRENQSKWRMTFLQYLIWNSVLIASSPCQESGGVTRGYKKIMSLGFSTSGIFFKYDMSSIMVRIKYQHRSIVGFLVRLCGIVGGIFATSGKSAALKVRKYTQQNLATCRATFLPCKLQSDVVRITTLVTTYHAKKRNCCRLKHFVAKSTKYVYLLTGMLHSLIGFLVDVAMCRFGFKKEKDKVIDFKTQHLSCHKMPQNRA